MLLKFLFLWLLASLSSCYSLKQAWHFNDLFNSRQLIAEARQDPERSEQQKQKLALVAQVLDFARSEGLHTDGAYQYVIDVPERSVSYTVQAAYWDRLELKEWWFPIVGDVPYLGFFDVAERDEKAQELISLGYEVAKGNVGAFSSLGWFDDPIYTSMLRRPDEDLAHLLFHELVHRSFWSAGSVRFNENLAEFCAVQLTLRFLQQKGWHSQIEIYLARRDDRQEFKAWLRDLKTAVGDLLSNRQNYEDEALRQAKHELVERFKGELPAFKTDRYMPFIRSKDWNNAEILSSGLYAPETELFDKAYGCTGEKTIGGFLDRLKKAELEYDDAFESLESLCAVSSAAVNR